MAGCVSFSADTKEFAAVLAGMTSQQTVMNNVVLNWHKQILEKYQEDERARAVQEYEQEFGEVMSPEDFDVFLYMTNPAYDPDDIESEPLIPVNVQKLIDDIENLMKLNLEMAKSMDTLNESIQADQGIDPLFREVKAILENEEILALVRLYSEALRNRE